jgi:membrane dipeptidase
MESPLRFAPEGDRVATWDTGLAADERARLARLEASVPWISLHDHPIRLPEPMTPAVWQAYTAEGRERVAVDGMRRGGLSVVFYSMLGSEDPNAVLRWAAFTRAFAGRRRDVFVAEDSAGAARARAEGAVALYLALESATPIGDRVDNVDLLWGAGVRSMGLTYNSRNTLGDGLLAPENAGLTAFGREAVRRMNELIAAEPRVSATAIQTVGSKGYDGFAVILVVDDL